MNSLPDWLKVLQLKPRFLFGLWLVGLLLLFLPDGWASRFGFRDILGHYRGWVGLGTIVALAFWLVQLIPFWQKWRANRRYKQEVLQSISSLSSDEWLLLAFSAARNQRTLTLELTHRSADALKAKGLLEMAYGVTNILSTPYTVPDFVWRHITANPRILFPNDEHKNPEIQSRFRALENHMRRHDRI